MNEKTNSSKVLVRKIILLLSDGTVVEEEVYGTREEALQEARRIQKDRKLQVEDITITYDGDLLFD